MSVHPIKDNDGNITGWQVRYRDETNKGRKKSFKRKRDAEEYETKVKTLKLRGELQIMGNGTMTFAEWWAEYMAAAILRPSTRDRDEGAARNWLLPALGDMALSKIQPRHVRALIRSMEEGKDGNRGLAPSTVRTYYGVLQGAMSAAVNDDMIVKTPCRGIKLSAERRQDPKFLTLNQVHLLAETIDPSYRAMVYLAAIAGLRFGECAGLKVGRLDFFNHKVAVVENAVEVGSRVIVGEPKTKMGRRTIKVPGFVMNELSAHLAKRAPLDPDDLVFTSPEGMVLRRKHFRNRVWLQTVEECGLEGLTFHGLRHSAAGFMIQADTHPRVMQKRMGHSSFRVTMDAYGSVLDDVDGDTADALDDLINNNRDDDDDDGTAGVVARIG